MEERAAERARLKAEREERKRKADEEKLAQLQVCDVQQQTNISGIDTRLSLICNTCHA